MFVLYLDSQIQFLGGSNLFSKFLVLCGTECDPRHIELAVTFHEFILQRRFSVFEPNIIIIEIFRRVPSSLWAVDEMCSKSGFNNILRRTSLACAGTYYNAHSSRNFIDIKNFADERDEQQFQTFAVRCTADTHKTSLNRWILMYIKLKYLVKWATKERKTQNANSAPKNVRRRNGSLLQNTR